MPTLLSSPDLLYDFVAPPLLSRIDVFTIFDIIGGSRSTDRYYMEYRGTVTDAQVKSVEDLIYSENQVSYD